MPRPLRPFWDLVDRSGECWLWTGAMSSGYGIYGGGGVRRVPDRYGAWIEWQSAHELFDPVVVDAAIAEKEARTNGIGTDLEGV